MGSTTGAVDAVLANAHDRHWGTEAGRRGTEYGAEGSGTGRPRYWPPVS